MMSTMMIVMGSIAEGRLYGYRAAFSKMFDSPSYTTTSTTTTQKDTDICLDTINTIEAKDLLEEALYYGGDMTESVHECCKTSNYSKNQYMLIQEQDELGRVRILCMDRKYLDKLIESRFAKPNHKSNKCTKRCTIFKNDYGVSLEDQLNTNNVKLSKAMENFNIRKDKINSRRYLGEDKDSRFKSKDLINIESISENNLHDDFLKIESLSNYPPNNAQFESMDVSKHRNLDYTRENIRSELNKDADLLMNGGKLDNWDYVNSLDSDSKKELAKLLQMFGEDSDNLDFLSNYVEKANEVNKEKDYTHYMTRGSTRRYNTVDELGKDSRYKVSKQDFYSGIGLEKQDRLTIKKDYYRARKRYNNSYNPDWYIYRDPFDYNLRELTSLVDDELITPEGYKKILSVRDEKGIPVSREDFYGYTYSEMKEIAGSDWRDAFIEPFTHSHKQLKEFNNQGEISEYVYYTLLLAKIRRSKYFNEHKFKTDRSNHLYYLRSKDSSIKDMVDFVTEYSKNHLYFQRDYNNPDIHFRDLPCGSHKIFEGYKIESRKLIKHPLAGSWAINSCSNIDTLL